MTPEQWARVGELFDQLLDLPPSARAAALSSVLDPSVRAEVESLLAHSGGPDALASAIGGVVRAAGADGAFDHSGATGKRLGAYRILRPLGHGGMGDVYEAVREDDFTKRVAIKMVRLGLDSEFAQKRFQAERQLLAHLEHPYIARLLDGGTAQGAPYLVLEYVDGIALDAHCQGRSREDILRLFLKVCEGVEHAHRNLVVHRDLKPANILVTSAGEPKLLDFGIAKLLEADPAAGQTTHLALTPQYASPEQVLGQTITTASDVYSLGAILYELLSGRKPYDVSTATAGEMERIICQQAPPRPHISEDLDNIILMALRKEPQRRYPSVRELAADIERSLTFHPVQARPDTVFYRTGRFLRRNRISIVAGALVAVALIGGAVVSQYQARRAAYRFAQVRQLANKFLFDFDAAIAPIAGTTKARELVVSTATEYLNNLASEATGDPALEAELAAAYEKLGDVQGNVGQASLGRFKDALMSYQRSCNLWSRVLAADRNDARFWKGAASAYFKKGDLELRIQPGPEAARSFTQGIESAAQGKALAPKDSDLLFLEAGGWFRRAELARKDSPSAAEPLYSKSLTLYEQLFTLDPKPRFENGIAISHQRLALVLQEQFRLTEAIPHIERALAIRRAAAQRTPTMAAAQRGVATALGILANVQGVSFNLNLGNFPAALRSIDEAIVISTKLLELDPADRVAREDVFLQRWQRARILQFVDPAAAVQQARAARAGLGINSPESLRPEQLLYWHRTHFIEASALLKLHRAVEAQQLLAPLLAAKLEPEFTRNCSLLQASILAELGRKAEALDLALKTLASIPSQAIAQRSIASLRDQGRLYELLATLEPARACAHAQSEQELWTEWQRRKAPPWYFANRLTPCR